MNAIAVLVMVALVVLAALAVTFVRR